MRRNYHRKLWGEFITGNYEEKLSQEIMRRNYDRKLWGEFITGNYEEKLSQEIMRRNYHRKLSASIYHHAKNMGIIGILAYPKFKSKRKRGNRLVPLHFRGKRAENCSHNVGKSLGEGLGGKLQRTGSFNGRGRVVWTLKYLRIHNIGVHINFYQNRFINESVRKNFLKFLYRRKDVRT